jgi:hypothetical protein
MKPLQGIHPGRVGHFTSLCLRSFWRSSPLIDKKMEWARKTIYLDKKDLNIYPFQKNFLQKFKNIEE